MDVPCRHCGGELRHSAGDGEVQTYKCAKCGKVHTVKRYAEPEREFTTNTTARQEMLRFVRTRGIEEEGGG